MVVGLGNRYRRDDGFGVAVADAIGGLALSNVIVRTGVTETTGLLDAWAKARLAVVIDAAVTARADPARIHRYHLGEVPSEVGGLTSHGIDIGRTHALARALERAPSAVVVFAVEAADTGHGLELTPQVAGAVPEVVAMAAAEINRFRSANRSQRGDSG